MIFHPHPHPHHHYRHHHQTIIFKLIWIFSFISECPMYKRQYAIRWSKKNKKNRGWNDQSTCFFQASPPGSRKLKSQWLWVAGSTRYRHFGRLVGLMCLEAWGWVGTQKIQTYTWKPKGGVKYIYRRYINNKINNDKKKKTRI